MILLKKLKTFSGLSMLSLMGGNAHAQWNAGNDEANRQSMMSDMRANAAANDRANFNSQQRTQAVTDRYSGGSSSSGGGGSSSSSSGGSSYAGGGSSSRSEPSGPQSIVATYKFTMMIKETPVELVARLEKEASVGNALSAFNLGRVYYTGFDAAPQDDAKARRWFGEAAKLGHPGAQSQYGRMLKDGEGGPADVAAALDWVKKSADQGDTYGEALYGYYRIKGLHGDNTADLNTAITYLTRAADKGQLVAQVTLGCIVYESRAPLKADLVKGAHYARLAAEQGVALCQESMGNNYLHGLGVPKDYSLAVSWFRKAVAQHNSAAMKILGQMELQGAGLPKDEPAGVALIKQAADAHNMGAIGLYGTMLQMGVGVPKNEVAGAQLLKVSAESHDPEAEQNYAIALLNGVGIAKNDVQGVYWQKRAADDGNISAAATYGVRLFNGLGVPTDFAEGLRYARIAANAENGRGMASLGFAYWNGRGVTKNRALGIDWFRKAAAQGDGDAIAALKETEVAAFAASPGKN